MWWCGAQVEPSLFTRAMMDGANRLVGSALWEGCRVAELLRESGTETLRGVALDGGEEVLGERVVLAMGPWSSQAAAWLGKKAASSCHCL